MNDQQIKSSSSEKETLTAATLSVYNDEGWVPLSSDPNHWVQVSEIYVLICAIIVKQDNRKHFQVAIFVLLYPSANII